MVEAMMALVLCNHSVSVLQGQCTISDRFL
jgi:hypothetical protein